MISASVALDLVETRGLGSTPGLVGLQKLEVGGPDHQVSGRLAVKSMGHLGVTEVEAAQEGADLPAPVARALHDPLERPPDGRPHREQGLDADLEPLPHGFGVLAELRTVGGRVGVGSALGDDLQDALLDNRVLGGHAAAEEVLDLLGPLGSPGKQQVAGREQLSVRAAPLAAAALRAFFELGFARFG